MTVIYPFILTKHPQNIRVVVVGYIRPEMRFAGGFPELLNRIKLDISVASSQLDALGKDAQQLLNRSS